MRLKFKKNIAFFVFIVVSILISCTTVLSQSSHPYLNIPYSVNPSFSVSIPYDLSLYDNIPGYINRFDRCNGDTDCVLDEVYAIERERNDLNWVVSYGGNIISNTWGVALFPEHYIWSSYCESPEQHAVNSIAEAIDTCTKSPDSECVCSYMPAVIAHTEDTAEREEDIAAFEQVFGLSRFTFDFGEKQDNMFNTLSFGKSGSNLEISLDSSSAQSQLVSGVKFKGVNDTLPGAPDKFKYERFGTSKQLYILKDKHDVISIIPKPSLLADSYRQCRVQNKILKFCVVQDQSFFAYDSETKRMGIQQLVLKFAYLFKGAVTDVGDFQVRDARLASNTSLLVWNPLLGVDVVHYTIYYSDDPGMKTNLNGKSPESLDKAIMDKLKKVDLKVAEKQDIYISKEDLVRPICKVDKINCSVKYPLVSLLGIDFVTAKLYNEKLYYSTADDIFFYFLPNISNDEFYLFAITATDRAGKGSQSFNLPADTSQDRSVDDLPPGLASLLSVEQQGEKFVFTINSINYSIDGTDMDSESVTQYRIYCFSHDIAGEHDLGLHVPLFAEEIELLDDDKVQFTKYLSDFDVSTCGFLGEPFYARFVIAGSEKLANGNDLFYNSNVTDVAFSDFTMYVPPEMMGEESVE